MRSAVAEYQWIDELESQEVAALSLTLHVATGGRILDLGVGAGRTVRPLLRISTNYVGVDYAPEMVEHCRKRFPGVRFENADARSLPIFADSSFDLVLFSCNGICMVDHDGRLAILREVHRLLSPGGYFVFGMANARDRGRHRLLALPPFVPTRNPAKLIVRAARFAAQTLYRCFNRLRYKRYEVETPLYAILNDTCHHYRTFIYVTTLEHQRAQLAEVGFGPDVVAFDLSGKVVERATDDGTLTLVARKPSAKAN
jgi:SAM-dependent methyltransferase